MVLTWLKRRWFRGRKQIFQFWDGSAWRYADPMVIVRGLQDHETFNWERHPVAVQLGDLEALAICAKAIRDVFHIVEFNGSTGAGLTEQECLELLARFSAYLGGVKKNGSPSPTSSESTESGRSNSGASPTATATNASSDFPKMLPGSEGGTPPA